MKELSVEIGEVFTRISQMVTQKELNLNEIGKMDCLHESAVWFSREAVLDLRKQAGNNPVTPLIVQKILNSVSNRSQAMERFSGKTENARLYKTASEILLNGQGRVCFSNGEWRLSESKSTQSDKYQILSDQEITFADQDRILPDKAYDKANSNNSYDSAVKIPADVFSSKLNMKADMAQSMPLSIVKYNDPMEEMDQLIAQVVASGKIPVLWSKARGLILKNLSKQYSLFSDVNTAKTADPKEIIRFIISRPQGRIAYILEDFHHYIGEKDAVNPAVGEIRSLIKDLNRTLAQREDRVYLFVPASYDMPPELALFFAQPPKRPKNVDGYLDRYGQLMTDAAYLRGTKPLVGASTTIDRLIQVLTQMETNNPLLVGYPGVGKTAVVEGLAMSIASGAVSGKLEGKMLYALSLNSLVAGTKYRGDLEIRLQGLMDEVITKRDRIIIFIDEIHTLLDAGSTEGSVSAGEFFKPLLARGDFPCIGATTFEGADSFAKDPAFARRFKKIVLHEPHMDEAIAILRGIAPSFERHHGVSIDDGALVAAVRSSSSYLPCEHLPGKAISLIDGAAAYCNMRKRERVSKEDVRMEIERLKIA
ncbi:MAG: ATP-dependent Clp protease ATP-binding subunit [Desulfamplus sp.]|nr:ATP-dependent Clp protease ATP-binding subunit [Desulfamplus sp.]